MSRLALLGGEPLTTQFVDPDALVRRPDLERQYLLEVHRDGPWDDFPNQNSMAEEFAREWAEFNRAPYCALVTNGTHTLQLALEALDIGYGDEVIVPGLTWQATASVVCDVNAVPVLVDIDPETLCLDPAAVEAAITPRSRAIMPVHLYNRMCEMDRIREIAVRQRLHIIEDCAHAHGSIWGERAAGTLGDFGSFSFQNSKLMRCGEGGALLTSDAGLYWKVVSQKSCGRAYGGARVHSGNYRLSSLQAAVLRGQLAAFRENVDRIDARGRELDAAVASAPGTRPLRRNQALRRCVAFCYAFLYDSRCFDGLDAERFRQALAAELGILVIGPYTPLNRSEVYYPHTKKRHQLGADYLEAISPGRWSLPHCQAAWQDHAMIIPWNHAFCCGPDGPRWLLDAIVKIYENRQELLSRSTDASSPASAKRA